jgi:hypothetical protein
MIGTAPPAVVEIAQAVDAALDAACDYLDGVDLSALPSEVQQGLALTSAAGALSERLLAALGVPDGNGGG